MKHLCVRLVSTLVLASTLVTFSFALVGCGSSNTVDQETQTTDGGTQTTDGGTQTTDGPTSSIQYPDTQSLVVHPDAKTYDTEKDVTFFVDSSGTYATMAGVINTSTPSLLEALLRDHPKVTLLLMYRVPGSDNDDANLVAARMVRKAQIATFVPADGLIASGGTDFFIAGTKRMVVEGGKVGVHSWKSGDGKAATDFPRDSNEHDKYLQYYEEMGFSRQEAEDFYFFTINAAGPDDMYNMTRDELIKYKVLAE